MEILQFFFDDFWHFVGICVVLGIFCDTVAPVFRRRK
jgi:hypothetical protein